MRISWWKWLPFQRWRIIGQTESADEIPDRLPRNGVALVGETERPKWIVFDCPCRTGHRIMLNADPGRNPRWTLNRVKPLTISPSIDFRANQRHCHYIIRSGQIEWTEDNDR
ncbi:DUF6527 family protein [Methylocystis bryophila]|uniref:Uncharacterized protein n=1 Tax=Methylocystis bryophila TaxID=655015 RepID=A0A1W6N2C1_9HYPH|nr:DUF6527 family protein [Methylocystis bryophila]ARN83959.1 hypothetical protein B1812_22060 [Methylocystis bryophila]